jgi:hypothetical protein
MSKLLLAVMLIAVVLGGAVSTASAETEVPSSQEAISALSEATGQPCGNITVVNDVATGGCQIHATSPAAIDMISHTIFGESVTMRCLSEFTGAMNGGAEIRVGASQIVFTNPASGGIDCTGTGAIRACTEAEAAALGADHTANWHITFYEEHATGQVWAHIERLCLQNLNPFNSTVGGEYWVRVTVHGSGHVTSFSAADHRMSNAEVPLSADAELSGSWNFEGDGVELVH